MSNLLAIPADWTAFDDSNPPDYWDGTKYTRNYEESSSQGQFFQMVFGGSISDGDVFAGTLSLIQGVLHDQPPFSNACYINQINTDGDVIASAGPASTTTPVNFSFAAAPGKLILGFTADDTEAGSNYDGTTNIAPVANPVVQTPCCELGRVTKAYVSAYQRNRVRESNLFSQEKRCLTANFNGALAKGRSIASVVWSCLNPTVANMQQAEVIDRETSVVILCQYPGATVIRCTATLDNAEQYTQMFRINVEVAPWFQGDPNYVTGPYMLTAVPV